MRTNQLIIALFQRFCWLDEGLQARLHDLGWPDVSRPQSMVMTNIVSGIVRPSDIARNLGVSRQAIHSTINQMVKLGIVRLDVDPDDRRHMIVSLTETGARMRKDAQRAMDSLTAQIAARIGQDRFAALLDALEADWGDNIERAAKR
ncbi:MarR family winged helix-turn-helix transcriptional regulator [Sphingopyxis sp. LK2115]|jgi:DNA-binding MarR family transcriptional regulator|uniref:MarR family winged helix-turn-helix transcriptional regulator n=1 Tax=Sphingopyxis sp. LK2115 TaxID=2744558 RepID=UPI001660B5D6|nr:MarR family winged helix-turn-helix transcriptional regulator [Sphingopyxis sp. LK2115]